MGILANFHDYIQETITQVIFLPSQVIPASLSPLEQWSNYDTSLAATTPVRTVSNPSQGVPPRTDSVAQFVSRWSSNDRFQDVCLLSKLAQFGKQRYWMHPHEIGHGHD